MNEPIPETSAAPQVETSAPPVSPPPPLQFRRLTEAPQAIIDAYIRWSAEGVAATKIVAQSFEKFNYKPNYLTILKFQRKHAEAIQLLRDQLRGVKPPPPPPSAVMTELQHELGQVNALLDKLPSSSEKASVLKSIIMKCVKRIESIEQQPFTPQLEQMLCRYLGEIRENVALFNKLSEQDRSEEAILEAVQSEFNSLLTVFKDIIVEVCPEHLPVIAEKLKLRLQGYSPNIHGSTGTNPPSDSSTKNA